MLRIYPGPSDTGRRVLSLLSRARQTHGRVTFERHQSRERETKGGWRPERRGGTPTFARCSAAALAARPASTPRHVRKRLELISRSNHLSPLLSSPLPRSPGSLGTDEKR